MGHSAAGLAAPPEAGSTPLASQELEEESERDALELVALIERFYAEEAEPFLERWPDLRALSKHLAPKRADHDALFDALGPVARFKLIAILRLCAHPAYDEEARSFCSEQEGYFKEDPEDADNQRYSKATRELKELLDGTDPLSARS